MIETTSNIENDRFIDSPTNSPVRAVYEIFDKGNHTVDDLVLVQVISQQYHYFVWQVFQPISIGCTGGQHRSVYVTEKVSKELRKKYNILVKHRDIK